MLSAVALTGWALNRYRRKGINQLPLPPGPKPLPLLGNLLDFPKQKEPETFERWYREYGTLCFVFYVEKNVEIFPRGNCVHICSWAADSLFEHC